jgi:predicted GNAT family N-acyltransferase
MTTVEASDYQWQVTGPSASMPYRFPLSELNAGFLAELSEFRGRILYADGRRPRFLREDGQYADDDPLDPESFHVTVRSGGALIGCARLTPLPEYSRSFIGERVGPSCLEAAVRLMNLSRTDCVEAGRWIVAPPARGSVLGRSLLLSIWVVGQWLGKRCALGAVGMRDGQSTMAGRFGGQAAPGIHPVFLREYDDEVSVMYFDLDHTPPPVAAQLIGVRRLFRPERKPLGSGAGGRLTRVCGMEG